MEKQAKGKGPLKILFKIDESLAFVEQHVATVLFIAMIGAMVFQVTARFILQFPAPWTEELSRYLWIGVGFVGTAVALRNHQHIEVNLIAPVFDKIKDEKRKAVALRLLDLLRFAIVFTFCVYMARMCFNFTMQIIPMEQLTPALQMPKWWIDAVICFGWAAMAFHSFVIIVKNLTQKMGDDQA